MKQFKHELLRKNLLFLYSIAGVGALGLGLFRPILPIFARRVGASGFEVGLLTSGYMFARAIISIIIGKFIDLSGRKKIFIEFGFFFVFIITFGLLFVKSYHFLFLLRFLQGICAGLIWPSAQIMVVDEAGVSYRTRALSLYQITGKIGFLLSRVILSLVLIATAFIGLDEIGSFRIVFLVSTIILFLGFTGILVIPESRKKIKERRKGKPPYSMFFLAFIFGALIGLNSISLVYINEQFDITPLGIAILLLCVDLMTILWIYITSYLTDHIGTKKSLWLIIVPCIVSSIMLPFTPYFIIFVIFYIALKMSISSFMPISRSYTSGVYNEVGINIGILNMMSNLGAVVGPILGGLIYDSLPGEFKIAGYSIIALFLIPSFAMFLYPHFVRRNTRPRPI